MDTRDGTEDEWFETFINSEFSEISCHGQQVDSMIPNPQLNFEQPPMDLNPSFETDLAQGEMQLDDALFLQTFGFSFDTRNADTTTQMLQPAAVPDFGSDLKNTNVPPSLELHNIEPAPSTVFKNLDSVSETSGNFLAHEFEQALRAVRQQHSSRSLLVGGSNGGSHKFRVNAPCGISRSETTGLNQERLKRPLARPCLLCRFLKRSCNPSTPCARCVEKCLGQRDLAFTACVRDNPLDFNPFPADGPEDVKLNSTEVDDHLVMAYLYSKERGHPDLDLLQWLFFESMMTIWVGSSSDADTVEPSNAVSLTSMQHWVTHHLFRNLEMSLRSKSCGSNLKRQYWACFIAALFLSAFLENLEGRQIPSDRSQLTQICRQYLFEYICLIAPRLIPSWSYDIRCSQQVTFRGRVISVQDFLGILTAWGVEWGPRTALQIRYDAWNVGLTFECEDSQLIERAPPRPDMLEWCFWPQDYPRRDDPRQVLGVWALFWIQIPQLATRVLNLSERDFLVPLLNYGRRKTELPNKTWTEWDQMALLFNKDLYYGLGMGWCLYKDGQISESDVECLNALCMYWRWSFMDSTSKSHLKPSNKLQHFFRLMMVVYLGRHELIAPDMFERFLDEVGVSEETSHFWRYTLGVDLVVHCCEQHASMNQKSTSAKYGLSGEHGQVELTAPSLC